MTYQNEDDAGNIANFYVYNDLVYLHAYGFPGLTLSLPATTTMDAGNALTVTSGNCQGAWTGASLVTGGGLKNSSAGDMGRTFTPFANCMAYRYLAFTDAQTSAESPQTRTLTFGGKTYGVVFPTAENAQTVYVDLCDPVDGGASSDTQDTYWSDNNPTMGYGAEFASGDASPSADGPLWGVNYPTGLTLSGFSAESAERFGQIQLAWQTEVVAHVLTAWEPRWAYETQPFVGYATSSEDGDDTTFIPAALRGLVVDADGRQSLELPSLINTQTTGGTSGNISYTPQYISIGEWAGYASGGGINGGPVFTGSPWSGYERLPSGWQATVNAPASDGSGNLNDGLLNSSSPACWLTGAGAQYVLDTETDTFQWQSGVGQFVGRVSSPLGDAVTELALSAQMLVTSVDWYPGCFDPFGFAPPGTTDNGTVYLAAHWISRGQAHGLLLEPVPPADDPPAPNQPAPGAAVLLLPGPGELQPATVGVGGGTGDDAPTGVPPGDPPPPDPQGFYRTVGAGLVGQDVSVTPSPPNDGGGANPDTVTVSAAQGTVQGQQGQASPASVSASFQSRKLSRVALVVPDGDGCCAGLLFHTPLLTDPIPALAGDEDALPVEDWRRE